MALGKSQSLETGATVDSVVWGGVLLGDGSAVAVLWGDYNVSEFYLTMAYQGAAPGAPKTLSFTVASDSRPHMAAVGQNELAVVWSDGTGASPTMTLFSNNGTVLKSYTYASSTTNYAVAGLGDNTFIVTWLDASSNEYYTRYDANGNAMAGQTAKLLQAKESTQAPSSSTSRSAPTTAWWTSRLNATTSACAGATRSRRT